MIETECPYCDIFFSVPDSMSGGMANCPRCEKAVDVGGGYEPLFWVLCGLGVVGICVFSGLMFWVGGAIAGGITFVIGVLIMGAVIALM